MNQVTRKRGWKRNGKTERERGGGGGRDDGDGGDIYREREIERKARKKGGVEVGNENGP